MMTRRRFVSLVAAVLGSLTVAVTAAWAGFPNIQSFQDPVLVYGPANSSARTLAAVTANSAFADPRVFIGGIVVTDVDHSVKVTLTTSFRATYVCAHGDVTSTGTTLVGHVSGSAVFQVGREHTATGSVLTQALPSAAQAAAIKGFACPSGETLAFDRAVFSELVLAAHGGERIELHVTLASHPVFG
jgi:hypothetical protein